MSEFQSDRPFGSVGAARVRKRPHCVAFLKRLQTKTLARHEHHKDRVIEELVNIAFADAGDLFRWGPDGVTIRDISELTPAQRRLVSIVSTTKTEQGGTTRLDIRSKLQALDKLCRLFGLCRPARAWVSPSGMAEARIKALEEEITSLKSKPRKPRRD